MKLNKDLKNKLIKLAHWLPALVWMVIIFILSSIPNLKSDLPSAWDMILRKGAHMFEYMVLALLIWLGLKPVKLFRINKLQIAFIVTFLYALSDEWHQTFVPTRDGNIFDVSIDTLGVIIGLIILIRISKR